MEGNPSARPDAVRAPDHETWHGVITWVVDSVMGAAMLAALAVSMLLGTFTRYVADDYGIADAVRLRGYWAQQVAAYRLSDGHFVATALYTAGTLLDPVFVRVLPALLIAAWTALLALALRHVIPAAGRRGRLLIAAGVVYTTLQVTPNPFLTVYWMTASLEFIVPLLVAAVVVWLMSRPSGGGRRRRWMITLIGALALLAAGEAEIYTAVQCVALTGAVAIALSRRLPAWRRKLPELGAAWIGSVLGLAVELASPGRAIRAATIARIVHVPRPSWLTLPFFSFGQMLRFLQTVVAAHWREMAVVAVLAALIGARSTTPARSLRKSDVIAFALTAGGALLLVWSAMTPAALYYGGLPPLWDQVIPVYVSVCAIAALGWLSGRFARLAFDGAWRRVDGSLRLHEASLAGAAVILSAAVVIGPIATVVAIDHQLPGIQSYAATKDAQAAQAVMARAAGRTSAVVPPLNEVDDIGVFSHPTFEDLTGDPRYWINEDEARYYGIVSIRTSP